MYVHTMICVQLYNTECVLSVVTSKNSACIHLNRFQPRTTYSSEHQMSMRNLLLPVTNDPGHYALHAEFLVACWICQIVSRIEDRLLLPHAEEYMPQCVCI